MSSERDRFSYEYVLLVQRADTLWAQNAIEGFLEFCDQHTVKASVINSHMDESLMMLNLSQAIRQEADAVVIMSPGPSSGWSIMSSSLSANIPIISLDEKITDSQGRQLVPYIGIDHQEAGTIAARWAAAEISEANWLGNREISYKIAVLTYDEYESMNLRTGAFVEELRRLLPGLRDEDLLTVDCRNGSAVSGLLVMQELLAQHPGISHWMIFGASSNSVNGAVHALEQLELSGTSLACCIDAGTGLCQASSNAVVLADTYQQGYQAARELYDYLESDSVIPAVTHIDIVLDSLKDSL